MRHFLIAAFLAISTVTAGASAFWHGTVYNVAYNDVLNVRKWPSAQSRIIAPWLWVIWRGWGRGDG